MLRGCLWLVLLAVLLGGPLKVAAGILLGAVMVNVLFSAMKGTRPPSGWPGCN